MKVNLYYALGPNCWGIAKTKEGAIQLAKENWPSFISPKGKPEHFSVWATDAPRINVSDVDGSITVAKGYTLEKIQTSTLAVREDLQAPDM